VASITQPGLGGHLDGLGGRLGCCLLECYTLGHSCFIINASRYAKYEVFKLLDHTICTSGREGVEVASSTQSGLGGHLGWLGGRPGCSLLECYSLGHSCFHHKGK